MNGQRTKASNNNNNNNNQTQAQRSKSRSQSITKKKSKKITAKQKLENDLQSLDLYSKSTQIQHQNRLILQMWTQQLQSRNSEFFRMFYDARGVETIIEKLLNGKETQLNCESEIVNLFDLTLQGSTMHHRYLVNELCDICKTILKATNDETSNVRSVIISQAKALLSSEKIAPSTMKNEIPKQEASLPSQAITQEREKDPINDKFDELDSKAIELNDIYHKLKSEDMTLKMMRPSVNESFQRTYRSVCNTLSRHIQTASQHQREHERELERCTTQRKAFEQEIAKRINPLQNELHQLTHRQTELIDRKAELQKELANINAELNNIDQRSVALQKQIDIERRPASQSDTLKNRINDHLYNIHGYRTEKECFEKLKRLTEGTNGALQDWCHQQQAQYSEARTDIRTTYLEHLREFLIDYSQIRQFLLTRTDKLRGYITDLKHRQEEAQRLLGPHSVHDNDMQIRNLSEQIDIDERINNAIAIDIEMRLKDCKHYVSSDLFHPFIMQINQDIGNIVDLSKFVKQAEALMRSTQSTARSNAYDTNMNGSYSTVNTNNNNNMSMYTSQPDQRRNNVSVRSGHGIPVRRTNAPQTQGQGQGVPNNNVINKNAANAARKPSKPPSSVSNSLILSAFPTPAVPRQQRAPQMTTQGQAQAPPQPQPQPQQPQRRPITTSMPNSGGVMASFHVPTNLIAIQPIQQIQPVMGLHPSQLGNLAQPHTATIANVNASNSVANNNSGNANTNRNNNNNRNGNKQSQETQTTHNTFQFQPTTPSSTQMSQTPTTQTQVQGSNQSQQGGPVHPPLPQQQTAPQRSRMPVTKNYNNNGNVNVNVNSGNSGNRNAGGSGSRSRGGKPKNQGVWKKRNASSNVNSNKNNGRNVYNNN